MADAEEGGEEVENEENEGEEEAEGMIPVRAATVLMM